MGRWSDLEWIGEGSLKANGRVCYKREIDLAEASTATDARDMHIEYMEKDDARFLDFDRNVSTLDFSILYIKPQRAGSSVLIGVTGNRVGVARLDEDAKSLPTKRSKTNGS